VNPEAARLLATMGDDELVDADGARYPFREPDRVRPTSDEEISTLVEGIERVVGPPSGEALRDEVEFLLRRV
jgi:hypothetical protein